MWHKLLYDNCNKEILKKFLVKIVIQTPYVKFDAFSGRNASFSLIKQSDEKWKCLDIMFYYFPSKFLTHWQQCGLYMVHKNFSLIY